MKDITLNELEKHKLSIKEVSVTREKKELLIKMESSSKIDDKLKDEIKDIFKSKFHFFNIVLEIEIIEMEKLSRDQLIQAILEMIRKNISSSVSWIKDIDVQIEGDELLLTLPNKMAYHSINYNGTKSSLIDLCKTNGYLLSLHFSQDLDEDLYLETKEVEERKMTKDILSNSLQKKDKQSTKTSNRNKFVFGKPIKGEPISIKELNLQSGNVVIRGTIFNKDIKEIKGNRIILTFDIYDGTDSITAKCFLSEKQNRAIIDTIEEDDYLMLQGDVIYDSFSKCTTIIFRSLALLEKDIRTDNSKEKRIELHLHSQMSSMDGLANIKKIAKRAKEWGHKAIAITDHGVVQAFPDAMAAGKDLDLKIIYGVEGYLIDDLQDIVTNLPEDMPANEFVVFDIETTGLSAKNDMITEIGAVKIKDGSVVDSYSQLIDPGIPIPELIVKLTGITDEMVKGKPKIDKVIKEFYDFIGDHVVVAHNAKFDIGFIRNKLNSLGLNFTNPVLDTLELSRTVYPNLKNHKLKTLVKYLDVELLNHHRAVDDAVATSKILIKTLDKLKQRNIKSLYGINNLKNNNGQSKGDTYHIVILVKNYIGLKNLYRLISESHINHFYRKPRIPKSLLDNNREGLIIGSACEAGELYKAIINNKSHGEIRDIVNFYDYLEIQPLDNNRHLIENAIVINKEELININRRIYKLGKSSNKLVVATGDVHFLDPEDEAYRRILMSGQGFSDADNQAPLYFKTTDEMLDEFSYLGKDIAKEVVIDNPNLINDRIEDIVPVPEGTFPPEIEGADVELKEMCYTNAYELYGNPLPEIVKKRLDRELTSIIKNGYSVMYIIAQKLVSKSNKDGYLVGSRGSVGSSFAATMSEITEINPLAPHYVCSNCKFSEFFDDGSIASGSDLKNRNCPKCDTPLLKDGQDIPFEVFLGFEGDKEPDIDLNFAGEYQSKAHQYTEKLFGRDYVYRAGTIGTIADKTAYGFVRKYFEEKEILPNPAEINRLTRGLTGVKRSSGQHPGGVMIVPEYKDIYDFTPIQYPADDKKSGVITTHFDYNAISGRILKLDILGHDVPSIIKMLEDMTGVDPTKIPLDEPETIKLFSSIEPMGISADEITSKVGSLGIPEFGTKFVRQMLIDTQPKAFSDLVRISGLSHGTDVWLNNAQDLVRNDVITLSEVISTREDIMLYLINAGMDKKEAFWIMEKVRKGKGLTVENEESMRKLNLPSWYIDSCNKIKYMFPKAHAAAYVMMSFRIAYFKVYHKEAFYCTYFTTKANDFDAELILQGREAVRGKIKELESDENNLTAKEKNLLNILEVALEMYARGLNFQKIDLYKSDSDKFTIGDEGILPPLKGLEGLGENAARNLVRERNISPFISQEDMIKRTQVTKPVIEALTKHGCLDNLPDSNQLSLFNI